MSSIFCESVYVGWPLQLVLTDRWNKQHIILMLATLLEFITFNQHILMVGGCLIPPAYKLFFACVFVWKVASAGESGRFDMIYLTRLFFSQ